MSNFLKQAQAIFNKVFQININNLNKESALDSVQSYMIRVILISTLVVTFSLYILLLISYFGLNNHYVSGRLLIGFSILLYLSVATFLFHRNFYKSVAWILILLYIFVATLVLVFWGINTPIGILLLGLIVILSSVMLGAKVIIPMSFALLTLLIIIQILTNTNTVNADRLWLIRDSNFGDVLSYATILGVFSLLAWLSRRQIEEALRQALHAESALLIEKDSLAEKVRHITRSLRDAQLKEMHQLYRFAELGQLTAVILHDLANHLSVLTLDIEELQGKGKKTTHIKNAVESIDYIEEIVKEVRSKLNDNTRSIEINLIKLIEGCVNDLSLKSTKSNVKISFNSTNILKAAFVTGDPVKLSQSMTILINNALDACLVKKKDGSKPYIEVSLSVNGPSFKISVLDNGIGIPKSKRDQLFKPTQSKKKNGLGIGLYITRQIIETHFHGTLEISPRYDKTEFIIALPAKI